MLHWNLNPEASKNVKAPIRPKQYARMVISGLKEEEAIGFEHELNDFSVDGAEGLCRQGKADSSTS